MELHRMGVIHRDVAARNFLIESFVITENKQRRVILFVTPTWYFCSKENQNQWPRTHINIDLKKKKKEKPPLSKKLNIKQRLTWGVWAGGADRLWSCLPGAACTSAPALPLENQPPGNQTGRLGLLVCFSCLSFVWSSSAQEYRYRFFL